MNDETYLLIGACGYLGNNVARYLVSQGKELRCLVLQGEDTTPIAKLNAQIFVGNVCDKSSLIDAFTCDKPLYVIHAAGVITTQMKMDERIWNIIVNGTQNVVDMCEEYGAKLVYVGSVDAIASEANPICEPEEFYPDKMVTLYGKCKAAATNIVLNAASKGLFANVVMPSAVFGPYDYKNGMLSNLLTIYSRKARLPLIKGGYDFVDVRDVAQATVSAFSAESGQTFILSNRYASFLDVVNVVRSMLSLKKITALLPNWLACFVGNVVETFGKITKKTPLFTAYVVRLANSGKEYDNSKARRELRFTPRSIEESVKDTVAFMQERGKLPRIQTK